jgi:glycolate oxidase
VSIDNSVLRALEARLRSELPADAIVTDPRARRTYECDGLTAYRQVPWRVLLPRRTAEVRAIVQACGEFGVPIVPRGAGTGLSGGALPRPDGVVMSLARMNRILEIDPDDRTARVQPGVRNLAVSEAARAHGLFYAPDPSSQIACSIGGNIAENAGGVHCLRYGLTVHNVQGLRVVLPDGELVDFAGTGPEAAGYDFLALFCGSEGLLGIVVEAELRLLPVPTTARVLLAAFDDVRAAGDAVAAVLAQGIVPAGMELMDRLAARAAEDFAHAGYPTDAQALLLVELDGTDAEVDDGMERLQALLARHGGRDLRLSRDEAERERLWKGRKAAFPAVGRIAPDYYCMDGTIPRHALGAVLARIAALSERHGLQVANVFHAGDGNLHPLILYDANAPGQLELAERFGAEILALCVEHGGTITGEHGVGVEKLDGMCGQFAPAELEQFHRIKAALDPEGLLNPGKGIPTLARCAELGGMHVHDGELPFPELDRL